jgi:hypothetical protein
MYQNLAAKGLGNFTHDDYWSSSETSGYSAWSEYFGNGDQNSSAMKNLEFSVRAAREF